MPWFETAEQAQADQDMVIEAPVAAPTAEPATRSTTPPNLSAAAQADALSALVNLGYGHGDAATAVAEASGTAPELDSGGLIKAALRLLAPKG